MEEKTNDERLAKRGVDHCKACNCVTHTIRKKSDFYCGRCKAEKPAITADELLLQRYALEYSLNELCGLANQHNEICNAAINSKSSHDDCTLLEQLINRITVLEAQLYD